MSHRPWRESSDGIEVAVRLTPRGGVDRIEGIARNEGGLYLQVRVAAPPVDGAANAALVAFLARTLDIPRSHVTLLAGGRGRLKRLHLRGPDLPARFESFFALMNE